ncbi:hypothetical protein NEUTE1DRAFT_87910 [Neurospora tetrasperma FGSC 2508]|uniref:DUF159-domain-containing protein n=1 Tax=Neurospora tetrasperma (strain FGSC 2508 / ATCC MYA-4615 / P0657) TaxID=510951 RepID=F8MXN6_NEUT8|nr:uncharacterized protein NEUTE1DRAFT_87910 [Neurospora tetrasperma FGSC 2508]EGO54507.1 hypothetical protein NEUTE1DRAFT_87910 [Neurospora tetrasperma FGSC 2508]
MCGRYAINLRPSEVRRMLQADNMPVDDAPDDEGDDSPRQSYNFAPGYRGVVYRARIGGGGSTHQTKHQFILQPMKWGLIPSWTFKSKSKQQKPGSTNYTTTLKTINCRDGSLSSSSGMWSRIKHRHRCVIPAQGFFEWLKTGPSGKEKIPHFVKRKDGKLMLFAGLWDCAHYTDEDGTDKAIWSYTIITTSSNDQLKFLHDRMPVILDAGSEELKRWLDPAKDVWNRELQDVLKPFGGELECYPVDKRVGKVGNDGDDLIVPVSEQREERKIETWFGGGGKGGKREEKEEEKEGEVEVKTETGKIKVESVDELAQETDQKGKEARSPPRKGIKREPASELGGDEQPPVKKSMGAGDKSSPLKGSKQKPPPPAASKAKGIKPISATKNKGKGSPIRHRNAPPPGTQKITKFFGNSA